MATEYKSEAKTKRKLKQAFKKGCELQVLLHAYEVSEDGKLNGGEKSRLEVWYYFWFITCYFFMKYYITIKNKLFEIMKFV